MPKQPHLFQRGDVWYHRVTTPEDVVEAYGKKNRIKSLRTRDRREAVKLARIEDVEADKEFDALRRPLDAPAGDNMPCAVQVKRTCALHYQSTIDDEFAWRREVLTQAEADPDAFYRGEVIPIPNTQRFHDLAVDAECLDDVLLFVFKIRLKKRLKRAQRDLAVGRHDRDGDPNIAREMLQAEIKAFEDVLARSLPEGEIEPDNPQEQGPLFTEAAEEFINERRLAGVTEKTLASRTPPSFFR